MAAGGAKFLNLFLLHMRVIERFLTGLDGERRQIVIRECSDSCFADINNGDWSRIFKTARARGQRQRGAFSWARGVPQSYRQLMEPGA